MPPGNMPPVNPPPVNPPGRLFCFGLGYTAKVVARRLLAAGWLVAGSCRSAADMANLAELGVEPVLFTGKRALTDAARVLAGTTHLLAGVPPGAAGDPVLDCHRDDLARLATGLAWAGYLSTTGVYGDTGGAWVDEASPLLPTGERQRRRVVAEREWLALAAESGLPLHIFRLAGIYGPGRSVLDQVRAGTAKRIDKPGHDFGRVHVDDIADVLLASMVHPAPAPGTVYNVCDDCPAPPEAVVAYACALLRLPVPPLVPLAEAGLSPMAASFWRDNRRVRNDRIKRELGLVLRHPDYRSGLAAVLAQE
ncbi:MAG: SDR family oxidoreductase [Rhodospirillaceae bacterium]